MMENELLITDFFINKDFDVSPEKMNIIELSERKTKIVKPFFVNLVKKHFQEYHKGNEIVILHDFFFNSILCSKNGSKNVKFVISLVTRNIGWFFKIQTKEPYFDIKYYYLRLINLIPEYIVCKKSDGIIVNSPEIKEDLIDYYKIDEKKIAVIPNPIDIDYFKPVTTRKSDIGISEEQPILLFVGNVFRQKGIFYLIESLAIVKEQFDSIILFIIGDIHRSERRLIKSLVTKRGLNENIRFIHHIPQDMLINYYSTADIFIFPSIYEGSPRVVQEAAACGCPIVATNISGIKILDPSEEFITFVEIQNSKMLAEKIRFLLENPDFRKKMSKRGITIIRERFSPAKIAQQTVDFYNSI